MHYSSNTLSFKVVVNLITDLLFFFKAVSIVEDLDNRGSETKDALF